MAESSIRKTHGDSYHPAGARGEWAISLAMAWQYSGENCFCYPKPRQTLSSFLFRLSFPILLLFSHYFPLPEWETLIPLSFIFLSFFSSFLPLFLPSLFSCSFLFLFSSFPPLFSLYHPLPLFPFPLFHLSFFPFPLPFSCFFAFLFPFCLSLYGSIAARRCSYWKIPLALQISLQCKMVLGLCLAIAGPWKQCHDFTTRNESWPSRRYVILTLWSIFVYVPVKVCKWILAICEPDEWNACSKIVHSLRRKKSWKKRSNADVSCRLPLRSTQWPDG